MSNMSVCCQTGYVLKVKDLIEPMTAYFHMLAWSFPAILTIIIMAMNQIEASSVYGELGRITNKDLCEPCCRCDETDEPRM